MDNDPIKDGPKEPVEPTEPREPEPKGTEPADRNGEPGINRDKYRCGIGKRDENLR